ncbi:MAG: SCP2 sterol-binding domain-containing protein [Proteobacteria bacterium]|nr:SCP2 sterol-binding domain-containing protein [Pseudomonadota bacterium]
MLASSAIAGLNHLLADAPWARERLTPFSGRVAALRLSPLELSLGVDGDGYFNESAAPAPDVTLELPLSALPKALAGGADALMADIRISGNADFADTLGFVFRQLRWDGEEALARLIGDIAAHRAVMTAQNIIGWQRQAARNAVENLVEYYSEERPVLVKHQALEELAGANAALRDDLARLEKRLSRLETALSQTAR